MPRRLPAHSRSTAAAPAAAARGAPAPVRAGPRGYRHRRGGRIRRWTGTAAPPAAAGRPDRVGPRPAPAAGWVVRLSRACGVPSSRSRPASARRCSRRTSRSRAVAAAMGAASRTRVWRWARLSQLESAANWRPRPPGSRRERATSAVSRSLQASCSSASPLPGRPAGVADGASRATPWRAHGAHGHGGHAAIALSGSRRCRAAGVSVLFWQAAWRSAARCRGPWGSGQERSAGRYGATADGPPPAGCPPRRDDDPPEPAAAEPVGLLLLSRQWPCTRTQAWERRRGLQR